MKILHCVLGLASLFVLGSTASGTAIDFTAGEGYTSGALDGKPSSGTQWDEEQVGVFVVDTSGGGSLGVAGGVSGTFNDGATYLEAFNGTNAITFTLDFTYTRVDIQPGAETNLGFGILNASTDPNAISGPTFALLQESFNQDIYTIRVNGVDSTVVGGSALGLDVGTNPDTTDNLRLTLTATHDTGNDWDLQLSLDNLDDASGALRTISSSYTGSAAFTTGDKYFTYNAGQLATLSSGSSVDFSQIELAQIPEPSTAAMLMGLGAFALMLRRRCGR